MIFRPIQLSWVLGALLILLAPRGGRGDEPVLLIQAMGDIMLGGSALETFQKEGYGHPFNEQTLSLLREGDVNFANLEGPITDGGTPFPDKTFTFRMEPAAAEGLHRAGFNLVSLANNHIMDFGPEGLRDTLRHLQAQGIHFAGAGFDARMARTPARITLKGKRIALLAYSLTFPKAFYATEQNPGSAFAYQEFLREDIPRIREGSDFLIVSFHWGKELARFPEEYQIKVARQAIDLGADAIFGHHPHVLQGIEIYRGRPIFYSLGNFAFSSYSQKVRTGMMARIHLVDDRVRRIELFPFNVFNPEVNVRPQSLSGPKGRAAIAELSEASEPFGTAIGYETDRGWIDLP